MSIKRKFRDLIGWIGITIAAFTLTTGCVVAPANIAPLSNESSDQLAGNDDMVPLTEEIIEQKRESWNSKNIRDYEYEIKLEQHGFPIPGIRVDVVNSYAKSIQPIGTTDRTRLSSYDNVTNFDEVFDVLLDSKRSGLKVEGQFDAEFGFPTRFRIVEVRTRSVNLYVIDNFNPAERR